MIFSSVSEPEIEAFASLGAPLEPLWTKNHLKLTLMPLEMQLRALIELGYCNTATA